MAYLDHEKKLKKSKIVEELNREYKNNNLKSFVTHLIETHP